MEFFPAGDGGPQAERPLRSLFLDAALEILSEADTPLDLRKVAERAGKSRTAPYLAFGKTEEGGGLAGLRLAVASAGLEGLVDAIDQARAKAHDPEEQLHAVAAAYLRFALDRPRLFRLAFGSQVASDLESPAPSPEARQERDRLRHARERLEKAFLDVLSSREEIWRAAATLGNPRLATGALWATLHGVTMLTLDGQWQLTRPRKSGSPEELASLVLQILTATSTRALGRVARALERAMERATDRGSERATDRGSERATDRGSERATDGKEREASMAPPAFEASHDDLPTAAHSRRQAPPGSPDAPSRASPSEMAEPYYFVFERPSGFRRAEPPPEPSPGPEAALRRARFQGQLARGARILWVDDDPRSTRHERRMLEGLGAEVIPATSTGEAAEKLSRGKFHLIVSDIRRPDDPGGGLRALTPLRKLADGAPLIFYVRRLDPSLDVPAGAFGITNRPDELLHLVFDALGRVRA